MSHHGRTTESQGRKITLRKKQLEAIKNATEVSHYAVNPQQLATSRNNRVLCLTAKQGNIMFSESEALTLNLEHDALNTEVSQVQQPGTRSGSLALFLFVCLSDFFICSW